MDGCVRDAIAPAGVDNERRRQDGHAADGTDKKFIDCPAATNAAAASDVERDVIDLKVLYNFTAFLLILIYAFNLIKHNLLKIKLLFC